MGKAGQVEVGGECGDFPRLRINEAIRFMVIFKTSEMRKKERKKENH